MQHETAYQTHVRLLEVIGHADVEVLSGLYAFVPCSPGALRTRADALAGVRDGNVWSIVVGRLQHDGHLPHSHLNDLRSRFAWVETPRH